ncbi:helix-turn-helix domain-containing protein (plasmid) [Streptosporangium sandarakinum]|uniref:helix-turn-helix domain-containing protein n=1 Tax=Streptosporangium sandarakinum TaxID=1260955 RepID=UPI003D938AC4
MSDTEARGPGRPTKLTPDLQRDLVKALENGHSIASAAALVGVSDRTVHRWMEQGEADDATDEIRQFRQALTQARATARDILINAAFQDAIGGVEIKRETRPDGTEGVQTTPPNGRIALELLARMFPEEWRPVKAVEVSGPNGGPVTLNHQTEIESSLARRIAEVKARRAARAEQAGQEPGEAEG